MTEELTMTELQSVKEIAANMGLKVGNMKNVDKIKAMIAEANEPAEPKVTVDASKASKRAALKKEKMKLVRVRITPMSPFERQLQNTRVAMSNNLLGDVHRVIPFERDWHVEECLLAQLRQRKYRKRIEETSPSTGRKVYRNEFLPAYGIVELPPLKKAELDALAADQKARNAID